MLGVTFNKNAVVKQYMAQCSIDDKQRNLGYFRTELEAHLCYVRAKNKEIKRVAAFFRHCIGERTYNRLMELDVRDLL